MITQHPEQTDKALRRLAQEYMSVRNLLREPILGFNLGTLFGAFRYVRTLNSPQSPNPAAFESGFVSLNVEEIGKLYDTTAGVGIAGRVAPPTVQKRGRHVAWLLVPIAIVLALGVYGFKHIDTVNKWLAHSMQHLFFHGSDAVASPSVVVTPHPPNAPSVPGNFTLSPARMFGGGGMQVSQPAINVVSNVVYCTGYIVLPHNITVFLSDGRTAESAFGDVQSVEAHRVAVFGTTYPVYTTSQIVALHPEMNYFPVENQPQVQQPLPILPSQPSDVAVLPLHDYRENLHNIKRGGFNQEIGSSSQARSP